MTVRTVLLRSGWVLSAAVLGFALYAWRSEIPPIDPPPRESFTAENIERGSTLVALGDCATCHTAAGGDAFAGGRPVATPFGTIYSTNITPDPSTGIGHWSQEAFERAMREGVDRGGSHLYPAFPYDHFRLITQPDMAALYAFIMTRPPVQARTPDNNLSFPLNLRFVLAGWKLMFLRKGAYESDPAHDARWNRGAYLANGIGHCGACHTPRNSLGAEMSSQHLGGGQADGWYAYAINSDSAAKQPWSPDSLRSYLKSGWHEQHGAAFGPMAEVTRNLAGIADPDLQAIADYVAQSMGSRAPPIRDASGSSEAHSNQTGADIYSIACAGCHDGGRAPPFGGIKLALSTAVSGESPINLINIVLDGMGPPEGTAGPIMPGFAHSLTDGQLESLIAYVRSSFTSKAPWAGVEKSVREARSRVRD